MALAQPEEAGQNLTTILTTALESRGVLGRIRAELRASVFSAIHEQSGAAGSTDGLPATLQSLHHDNAGRLAAQLVLELLATCQLDYSLSVLRPEANLKSERTERASLAQSLGLTSANSSEPLLVQLVRALVQPGGAAQLAAAAPPAAKAAELATAAAASAASTSSAPAASSGGGGGGEGRGAATASTSAAESSLSSSAAAPLAAQPPAARDLTGREGRPFPKEGSGASGAAKGLGDSSSALRSAPPASPPSPASPLLSVLPPLGKPKATGPGYLSDLPPLSSRGATVPPLSGISSMPPTGSPQGSPGGGGGGGSLGGGDSGLAALAPSVATSHDALLDERRLDALENKLSNLAGLPLRPAAASIGSQLAPLGSSRLPVGGARPSSAPAAAAVGGGGGGSSGGMGTTTGGGGGGAGSSMYDEEEVLEEDFLEESFEEDVDDASLSLDGASTSAGGLAPPLHGGLSPASLSPGGHVLDRHRRQRLSPLETSLASLDEAISPSQYKRELAGYDLAESIERP